MVDVILTVVAVCVIVIGTLGGLVIYSKYFIRIPPNKAMVVFGRRRPHGRKYAIYLHGGMFVTPIFEDYAFLPLEVFTIELDFKDLWSKDKQRLTGKVVLQYKIRSDETGVEQAAENFYKKDETTIRTAVEAKVLESGTEAMGSHDLKFISTDRSELTKEWLKHANDSLGQLGIEVKTLVLKDLGGKGLEILQSENLPVMRAHLKDLRSELAELESKLATIDNLNEKQVLLA